MLELKDRISNCRNLTAALGIIRDTPASGVLKLMSETLKGSIAFSDGKITGAYIEGSNKRGDEAFVELARAQFDGCECQDLMDYFLSQPECRCNIDLGSLAGLPGTVTGDVMTTDMEPYYESVLTSDQPDSAVVTGPHPAVIMDETATAFFEKNYGAELAESSLNEHQRALLEQSRQLHDPEAFYEAEKVLDDSDASEPLKNEILATVELDESGFDTAPRVMESEAEQGALGPEQQHLLKAYAQMRDAEGFQEHSGTVADDSLLMTEQEAWIAEQQKNRPAQEVQAEFVTQNPELEVAPDSHFVPFVEPPLTQAEPSEESSKASLPDAGAEDFSALIAPAPVNLIQKDDMGLLSRATDPDHITVGYDGPQPQSREISISPQAVGMTVVAVLCIGLFTLPGVIRGSVGADNAVAVESMRSTLRDEMREEVPYNVQRANEQQIPAQPGGIGTGAGGGGGGGGGGSSESSSNSDSSVDLASAKKLAAQQPDKAIEVMQASLDANPNSVELRMELIKLLLARKQFEKARFIAIVGFKDIHCSPAQHQAFWALYKQCQP